MLFRVAAAVALLFVGLVAGWATPAGAEDAKGCEGLTEYREAIIAAWQGDEAASTDSANGNRDPMTLSSDEWLLIADGARDYQRVLKEIDPPGFAEDWHQAQIELIGLLEQSSRAAAKDGVFAMFAFAESIEEAEAKEAAAVEAGAAICPDFGDFVQEFAALRGDEPGTPESQRPALDLVPIGQSATVADRWAVQVVTVFEDAHEIDPTDDFFNDWIDTYALPEGDQYFALRLRITNDGSTAGDPTSDLSFSVLSETDFAYRGLFACGDIPGGLSFGTQLDAGETIEANVCWVVRTEHVPSLRLRVEPSFSFDDTQTVWFSLKQEN